MKGVCALLLRRLFLLVWIVRESLSFSIFSKKRWKVPLVSSSTSWSLSGWVESNGEWNWVEDDPSYVTATPLTAVDTKPLESLSGDGIVRSTGSLATPKLPSGSFRPKQSLGQNFLKDPNTVAKLLRAFHSDAIQPLENELLDEQNKDSARGTTQIVELGSGAGALTDKLVERYGVERLLCIEIDERSVAILQEKHGPNLRIQHADVLQINYASLAATAAQTPQTASKILNNVQDSVPAARSEPTEATEITPLVVIGNLPYYITSQILFALADASHVGAVRSATVTMQWEVGQRLVAPTHCKDYGILSVVFQLYCASIKLHFKIPPTVFYPQPKVDSALLGFHFCTPDHLRRRLAGVRPEDLRRVVTATFQQRRKTVRNSLKKLLLSSESFLLKQQRDKNNSHDHDNITSMSSLTTLELVEAILQSPPLPLPSIVFEAASSGDTICQNQALPADWASKRPEELSPGQFVELTRLVFGTFQTTPGNDDKRSLEVIQSMPLGSKVWRKLKHGSNST